MIKLVQHLAEVDFLTACEILTGAPPPRRTSSVHHAELARKAEERQARADQREVKHQFFREQERRRLHDMWRRGKPVGGSPVEAYLALRQVGLPRGALIRCLADAWLYPPIEEGVKPTPIHKGPAMMAAIIDDEGKFAGLHLTWIDLNDPEGKARVMDPDTGEIVAAKKVRGSQMGGRIEILRCNEPTSLLLGEGIEEVSTVLLALDANGWDLSRTAAWSGINLYNIGGEHIGTVVHPTATRVDKLGRVREVKVPSDQPDMTAKAIPIPDSVTDLVLLGDGDSERFLTEMALRRAAHRYARPGRTIRIVWSPEGSDWNKTLRKAVA